MNNCICCNSKKIKKIVTFKNFPITGKFTKNETYRNKNLKLYICKICSHLFQIVKPSKKFYDPKEYVNRPQLNFLAPQALNFFKEFFEKNSNFKGNILEIGAGDTMLYNLLKKKCKSYTIIDPITKNYKDKKLEIFQSEFEKFSFEKTTKKFDYIILSNVIEHLENPHKTLMKVLDNINEKAKLFIEVPLTNLLIKNLRYDQIFFQHISYFSNNSIRALANKLNLKISKRQINFKHWGGTILFTMERKKQASKLYLNNYEKIEKTFLHKLKVFKKKIIKIKKNLKNKKIIGYGAGQNTPIIAYHLNSNLNFLRYIVDENKEKFDLKCINTNPKIQNLKSEDLKDSFFLITAIDNSVIIEKKLKSMGIGKKKIINFKKILNPKNRY